ncbi:histone H4 transcription factor-like [Sycon ciliatum]|uniref:histone H4 transcription factor-like n=1 Tax=Sycon ciliatum TaxID=27933 RepID=UPI0031F6795F
MEVRCEWNECPSTFTDMADLPVHCRKHINEFHPMPSDAYLSQTALLDLGDDDDEEQLTGSVNLRCLWRDCQFKATSTLELALHVGFHPQHCVLKALGAAHQQKSGLHACSLSVETRSVIPDIPAPYACGWEDCNQEFREPMLFYRHIKDHIAATPRLVRPDGEPGIRRYVPCGWTGCSQQTLNRTRLSDHVRTHTGERVIACPVCGGLFINATKFSDHLTRQVTTDTAYYQCSHCCKRLQSERLLRDHMRQHVNSVHCQLCSMTCPSPAGLRKHMFFKHTSDRPFCCNFCTYRAKTLVDMRRHSEKHNEKSAYGCPESGCSFESRTYASLRHHYNRVHREGKDTQPKKLYCCQVCHRTYRRGQDLTRHLMRKHHYKHPPSHKRFRYMRGEDGFMYLQLIRFESALATSVTAAPAWSERQPQDGAEYAVSDGQPGEDEQYEDWEEGDEYADEDEDLLYEEEDMEYEMEDYEEYSPTSPNTEVVQTSPVQAQDGSEILDSVGTQDSQAAAASVESPETEGTATAASEQVPAGAEDDRYQSAMAMLDLISAGQDIVPSPSNDVQASAESANRSLGLLQGLAQLTGQSIEAVAQYFAESAGDVGAQDVQSSPEASSAM